MECLNYNEVYDLYHDDYPALYVGGEETQVQQLGTYHQYQSFTDVAAIEGKLVISSSWHPNYTGMDLQKSLMNVNSLLFRVIFKHNINVIYFGNTFRKNI